MPLFNDIAGLLRSSVGNNLDNRAEDIENTKRNFANIGRYKKPIENGYIDEELDRSIWDFQRDNSLKRDGFMNPGGETEAELVSQLMKLPKIEPSVEDKQTGIQQVSALPALGARLLGLSLGAAGVMEWWKNHSTDHRENIAGAVRREQNGEIDENESARCEALLRRGTDICNEIRRKHGATEAAICRGQLMEVYAACRAGKPESQWPPFPY